MTWWCIFLFFFNIFFLCHINININTSIFIYASCYICTILASIIINFCIYIIINTSIFVFFLIYIFVFVFIFILVIIFFPIVVCLLVSNIIVSEKFFGRYHFILNSRRRQNVFFLSLISDYFIYFFSIDSTVWSFFATFDRYHNSIKNVKEIIEGYGVNGE